MRTSWNILQTNSYSLLINIHILNIWLIILFGQHSVINFEMLSVNNSVLQQHHIS